MSSTTPEQTSTPADGLRDDELSKRFFYGGMLGLPWLWIAHAINFHGKQRSIEAQRMLREEQNSGKNERQASLRSGLFAMEYIDRLLTCAMSSRNSIFCA